MKLDAHPLVVAVALGLLGPAALASDDDEDEATHTLTGVPDDEAQPEVSVYTPGVLPDPDEIHRVEIEWLKSR